MEPPFWNRTGHRSRVSNGEIVRFYSVVSTIPGITRRAILDCCGTQFNLTAERVDQLVKYAKKAAYHPTGAA